MNKIKTLIKSFLGILLIGLIGAVFTTTAQEPAPTDVNVVNTPQVTVTNRLGLVIGTTVGIDPAKNTVKVDNSQPLIVQSNQMVLLFNQGVTLPPYPTISNTAPINISAYSKIRVIVVRTDDNQSHATITPRVHFDDNGVPGTAVALGKLLASDAYGGATQLYENLGPWLSFSVHTNYYDNHSYRIQVFGRK